jgi:hypothetical protein
MTMKQRSCDGGGGAAPRLAWQCAQKDGCAQRTGAHARPKPTSSLCFNNQTDQGDETEGLEMEGLEMEGLEMER